MFQTTADVYYIIASIAITLLTVFGCIALYHLIRILSRADTALDAIEGMLERVGKVSSYIGIIGSAAQMLKDKFGSSDDDEDECEDGKKKKLPRRKK